MANGRNQGPNRRRGNRHPMKRSGFPTIEFLEDRQLLSGNDPSALPSPLWKPTSTNIGDVQNGPMANMGQNLIAVYQSFLNHAGQTSQLAGQFPLMQFRGSSVLMGVNSLGGDFEQFKASLQNLGMNFVAVSAYYGAVDGWLPVSQLPVVAQMAQTMSGHPIYKPVTSAFQGVADNEAQTSMFADTARTQLGVDGTGVTVGILSDSVNQFAGGLQDSYNTGDLDPNNPVTIISVGGVLQDGPAGSSDEGRAMAENIHDIAPGAKLQFATADTSDISFGQNIVALANAGSNIVVDDVYYFDEPMFQDGVIAQGVNTIVAQGKSYFGSAGNRGTTSGYLSTYRNVQGTVTGVGTGNFMDFDPGSPTNLLLPITTSVANATVTFQFDQPYTTQQPAGSPGRVTSQLNFYVLDGTGAIVAQGNTNNVATQQPLQMVTVPNAGSYFVAIQLVSGPSPGHVQFVGVTQGSTVFTVSTQFGSAGGTSYPSSFGHHAAPAAIGVAATPWWAPAPYLGQFPLNNEPFSSSGPSISVLNPDGTPKAQAQTVQNPTITAPDGGNTSFFPPGGLLDTSNPPFPGQPATTTNLAQPTLPAFFGTSSAAPNAAAVAALMLQKVPTLTPAQIRQGLIASAVPMNNTPAGTWNAQSGFGLINAIQAINAVDVLRVVSTSPANGATVTVAPGAITVTFNKAVDFSTVSAANLVFIGAPPNVTPVVGTPIAVDDPKFPTIVQFPFSFIKPVGTLANGQYAFQVQGSIVSKDGKGLVTSGQTSFRLADTTAPKITNTAESGRLVTIQFNEPLDPATVTLSNIFVIRSNGLPWNPSASNYSQYVNLNTDPRTRISYNAQARTVTLDYGALPQTAMPTDFYAIVVLSGSGSTPGVTDLVGNSLDGEFNGFFPSGNNQAGGTFVQNLGQQALSAPTITTLILNPSATNDTGLANDQNTNVSQPTLIGQVTAAFPGSAANATVFIQFSGLHGGTTDLTPGGGGRGFFGSFDRQVTTDANGAFTVTPPSALPEGFQTAVAVVVGQPDQPPLPGYSSTYTDAFRIDKSPPTIVAASFTTGGASLPLPGASPTNITNVSNLTTLILNVVDPVHPNPDDPNPLPLFTPGKILFPALDPSTVLNISNFSLINTTTNTDQSQYITSARFDPDAPQLDASQTYIVAYLGHITLTFATGLPSGNYQFVAHTKENNHPGLADAAGNFLDNTSVAGEGTKSFVLNLAVGNVPAYITNVRLQSGYSADGSTTIGGPRSYFELPDSVTGLNTRDHVPAAPTAIVVDLSNPVFLGHTSSTGTFVPIDYSALVQLVRSADPNTTIPDGDFGTLGQGGLGSTGTTGFTRLDSSLVSVALYQNGSPVAAPQAGQPDPTGNQLVLTINGTLEADYYRIYMPNQVSADANRTDTRIFDIYGNQLDGEFLGDQTASGSWEDLLPNGQYRSGISGDGIGGGAFLTGFAVVPYGNIVYARPDYVENPLLDSTLSDGSLAKPYPTLAPEGDPNTAPDNPNHDPNGGLNSSQFFLSGFKPQYDRNGDGQFQQSALYAASQLAYRGPVVVVALPGTPTRDPVTGELVQKTFVMQAPAGSDPVVNNGSASVPFNTTLVFTQGSTLKLLNATLFVQNQGSAIQAIGTPTQPVTFTSYNDASIGGRTNNNPNTTPHAGDWGGLVLRNYDEAIAANRVSFPAVGSSGVGPGPGVLVGLNGGPAVSGAQDAMSSLNFATVRYAGGAVPASSSNFYSGVTLFNARPALTNSLVTDTGVTGGTEGAIGQDFDSLREDDTARGPLIRRVTVTNNSLNGIWLMAQANGFIQPTSAMPYPTNPSTLGGSLNYTLDDPLPYIVLAQLIVGQQLLVNSGGATAFVGNRLYIQPGMMVKYDLGAGLDVLNPDASLNVGSRSYIHGFDLDNNYGPDSANFVPMGTTDAQVLFTTIHDNTATTSFFDPATQQSTIIVPAINVTGEATTPPLVPAMWGSVGIQSGAKVVINHTAFKYGGGLVHTPTFSIPSQSVLAFLSGLATSSFFPTPPTASSTLGSKVYITNNDFISNYDAAMQIEPNGLLAGDPMHPLLSGHPFFRNNIMQNNGIDGLAVVTSRSYFVTNPNANYIGPVEAVFGPGAVNQTVSAVWDATDLSYVVRGTIILGGAYDFFTSAGIPVPNLTAYAAEPKPVLTLTIQSALPGTRLADGSTIPSPGQSVIVKLLSDFTPNGSGALNQFGSTGSAGINQASTNAGAGFIVGVDDGVDPPVSPLIDSGAYSQLRILGIPGNQTTGQQRVPVILTSLRDNTVGTTVRGVKMFDIFNSWPTQTLLRPNGPNNQPWYFGQSMDQPGPGDGGYIYIGGNSLTDYNLTDPRDGSLIDNADISYLTRIEIQGGGIIDTFNQSGTPGAPVIGDGWLGQKSGYGPDSFFGGLPGSPINQFNSAMAMTISNSTLANFQDAAVFTHPDAGNAFYRDWTGRTSSTPAPFPVRGGLRGQPVVLYMYNNTVYNTQVSPLSGQFAEGVHINSETSADTSGESPMMAVILNNTFYQTGYAIRTEAAAFDGTNSNSHVNLVAMNNIFSGSTAYAVSLEGTGGPTSNGMNGFSQLQYNVFWNNVNTQVTPNVNPANVNWTTLWGDFAGNSAPIIADPQFVDPANGNFKLKPTSPAIDAGRSEIGPLPAGDAIFPTVTQQLNSQGGIRTNPATLPTGQSPGRSDLFGGFGGSFGFFGEDPRKIVTLPGSGLFAFQDEWVPVLTTNPNGISGPASVSGTYNYAYIDGQRDSLGYIRVDNPNAANTGYGRNPFIDVGAFEFIDLHPPKVAQVTATTAANTTIPFYTVGGKAGSSQTPQTINVTFTGPLDPASLTAATVLLQASGGDGIFGNGNSPGDQFINLAGKLAYNSATNTLVINLGAAGLTLASDAYRLTILGSGSPVVQNSQGIALDGENTVNGDPNGVTLALPSGDGYPGGNFYDTFIINSTPSSVVPGSLKLEPSSDTNIAGDSITASPLPTFIGSITEPNPTLVPLAGQTAVIDIGIFVNGQTYFAASQLPASLSNLAQYIRPNAGTGLTNATGGFSATIGLDGAASGLVTNTSPLPGLQGVYNVGPDGLLAPVPGDDSGFYVARARTIDQSGNQSDPNDPNARTAFIVDTTAPTVQFAAPSTGQVITSLPTGALSFTITTSENIDLSKLTANSIVLTNAGPDGILGTADDVTIPINGSSISATYLDKGTGGTGRMAITFQSQGTLTNSLYKVTLLSTGADAVRDIAGNTLAADTSQTFALAVPSLAHKLFVGAGSYVSDPNAAQGSRANPYPTISAAMTAATAGDVVAVLAGVYTENVNLKQFVRLYSVDSSSTDSTVFSTSTGDPLSTIIRSPSSGTPTVSASNLNSLVGLQTEVAGFTIASPLVGDPALGFIDSSSVALGVFNSNILVDKNYFADAGNGIFVTTSGAGAQSPQIQNNIIVGNITGVALVDDGTTTGSPSPTLFINNDFVFNNTGLVLINYATTPAQAYLASNIFWQNHDLSNARNGLAIYSVNPGKVSLRNNLFSGNGPSDSSPADDANDLGNGFSAAALGATPDAFGNFVGKPAFVSPRDPRPGSDGPASLFVDANFDLTAQSAAIDNGWEVTAIPTDILGRTQVDIPGAGYGLTGYGPRDVGAYEYKGSGGLAVGGSFRVVTTSLVPIAGASAAQGATLITPSAPTSITVTFSRNVDPKAIQATDLILNGSAVDPRSPARATSLSWIDGHTVQFNLTGQLDLPGTLGVSIRSGSISSSNGQRNLPYSDNVVVQIGTPPAQVNPTPLPTATTTATPTPTSSPTTLPTTLPITPVPASAPVPATPAAAVAPIAAHPKKKKRVAPHPKANQRHIVHPKTVKHGVPHPKADSSLKLSKAGHKPKKNLVVISNHPKKAHHA